MKSYAIGRDASCNIVIYDPQNMVSRHHAVLNIADNGKMTIIDQSTNGTYINGIRITTNIPVPVTRKDKVSFAHVANLDWNMVKASNNQMRNILIAVGLAVVLALLVWLIVTLVNNYKGSSSDEQSSGTNTEQVEGQNGTQDGENGSKDGDTKAGDDKDADAKTDKDKADKDKADKDKADKDKADKNKADKDKADKDKATNKKAPDDPKAEQPDENALML